MAPPALFLKFRGLRRHHTFDWQYHPSWWFCIGGLLRFGTAATTHSNYITTTNDLLINGDFEVDASAQFDSFVQMDTTATTSFSIRSTSATQGACIELKDDDGTGYTYLRVSNGAANLVQ